MPMIGVSNGSSCVRSCGARYENADATKLHGGFSAPNGISGTLRKPISVGALLAASCLPTSRLDRNDGGPMRRAGTPPSGTTKNSRDAKIADAAVVVAITLPS